MTTPRLLGLRTLKGALQRLSVTMLLMLLTTMTAWADVVTYIDMDGQSYYAEAFPLGDWESSLGAGWYYVDNDITYDGTIECHGDVHIILADGKTMTITSSDGNGINVRGSLTFYGQELGTGTLNATGGYEGIHSDSGDITIYGGRVTVTGGNNGIHSDSGDITICGGRVNVTSDNAGIFTYSGDITLGCTTVSDFIYASSYFVGPKGSVKVADGQTLYDEYGRPYSGTLTDILSPDGATLCSFFPNVIAQYIDAAGKPARCAAIPLSDWESMLGHDEQETWYYVDNDITYDRTIDCHGDVHIILADGKTMTINRRGYGINVNGSLTIYGQAKGTGTLNVTGSYGIFSGSGSITISGGTVNVTGDSNGIYSDFGTITICGGRVNVTGVNEGIHSNSGDITICGGRVTVTGENAAGIFTNSGDITLGCTTASDFIYASSYNVGSTGTVKVAEGQTLYDEYGTEYSGTLTDILSLDGKTLRPFPYVNAQYIDAAGKPASHDAIALDGTESTLGQDGQETWYYVGTDITYDGTIDCYGDVHIILADGKTLTITSSDGNGINGADGSLTIYGQAQGTGILTATGSSTVGIKADGFITINGGTVNATGNNDVGIYGVDGVTINGGTVNATGIMSDGNVTIKGGKVTSSSDPGFSSNNGDIILGWTTASDFIYASSYVVGSTGTVKVAEGQTLTDQNGNSYSGTLSADEISAISEQTLTPDFSVNDAGTEYTIHTATGWNVFCDQLANNAKGYFTGKTVTLGNDIPTAEEKAAGTTAVTRMAGSSGKDFTGTFNGGGYTLTVGYEDAGNNTMTAPFAYVDGATIQNLIIDGSINDTGFRAAGVIGETNGSTSHITNCVSSLTISGGRYTGGFSIGGNVEIEGCVFNGKINGSSLSGGFVGYSNSALKIINSLFAPKDGSSISGGTFYYNGGGNITPNNSFYTEALGTAQGNAAYVYTPATTDFVPANVGAEGTAYDVSGITAYATGLKRNGKFYLVKASVNLTDNGDNSAAIVNKQVADVTLSGRKLWKDGDWNTLCLPFSLASLTNTPLEGANVMELDTEATYNSGKKTGLDGTTLYLYFKDATSIEAGVPYIVKWDATTPDYVENPCFTGVTVEKDLNNVTFTGGAFKGTYAWQQYTVENKSILLLGTQNTLYWPKPDGNTYPSIGACRAYFELSDGQQAREFVLNFDGDYTTRIISTTNLTNYTNSAGAWFDLSGRKLDTKPTKKGVYIYKGKKRVIK